MAVCPAVTYNVVAIIISDSVVSANGYIKCLSSALKAFVLSRLTGYCLVYLTLVSRSLPVNNQSLLGQLVL